MNDTEKEIASAIDAMLEAEAKHAAAVQAESAARHDVRTATDRVVAAMSRLGDEDQCVYRAGKLHELAAGYGPTQARLLTSRPMRLIDAR